MRPDEFASLVPGRLGNFEHALFIGGVPGSLTLHVANSITGDLTVCDFDNTRLSELSFTVYRSLLTLGMYFRFQLEARISQRLTRALRRRTRH